MFSRGLFISYLCDLFFIFSFISIVINYITSLNRCTCFWYVSEYLLLFLVNSEDEESQFSNSKSSASGSCLTRAFFQFQTVAGFMKSISLYKKAYTPTTLFCFRALYILLCTQMVVSVLLCEFHASFSLYF